MAEVLSKDLQADTMPSRFKFPSVVPALVVLAALAILPLIVLALGDAFLIKAFTRGIIFAIAAVGLNLILGYGGLVSLMHASLFGIGGYTVGILAFHDFGGEPLLDGLASFPGTPNLAVSLPLALGMAAIAALVTGIVSLRTSGTYFIMITLAFNEMLYYFFVALQTYGGQDGLQILSTLTFVGYDITGRISFYYICLALLAAIVVFLTRLVDSRFGVVLRAASQNEQRVIALGIAPLRYKLVAFVISGMIAGLAGALMAVGQQFISPADISWTRSGDLIVMAVLGGMGTVWGPVIGALVFVTLELVLSSWTTYWHLPFGILVILIVVFLHGGLVKLWPALIELRRRI